MTATPANTADALAAACRDLAALGLSPGSSGNASVRTADGILTTPTGLPLSALTAQDISVLDSSGRHRAGPPPTKEAPLHLRVYARLPHHGAVVHLHSTHAVAVACLEPAEHASVFPPYTPYSVMRLGAVPLLPYAPPGSERLAALADRLSPDTRACLLAQHGSMTMGADLGTAIQAAVELEETARIHLLLAQHRGVRTLSPDEYAALRP
ncbi:class II aldolase/adducin family protein [Streptomyces sp. NPDC059861]|uniref:class II aldolase/adducin family protein n=1 Tax=Streptomyces sp. NPDC059861 TaxID=3346974 RepID=UPI003667D113